jgi:hypothetical protein
MKMDVSIATALFSFLPSLFLAAADNLHMHP